MIFQSNFSPNARKNHITRSFHNRRVVMHVPEKYYAHSKVQRHQNKRIIQPCPGHNLKWLQEQTKLQLQSASRSVQ